MPKPLEIATAALTALGVEDEVVNTLLGDDQAAIDAVKPDDLVKVIQDTHRANLEHDEDFIKPIESRVRGAAFEQKEREAIKLYKDFVTADDLKKLPEKERFAELLKLISKRVSEAVAKGSSDPDHQKKIEDLLEKVQSLEEENTTLKEVEIPKVKAEGEGMVTAFKRSQIIDSTFRNTLGDKLIAKADVLRPGVMQALESKYDLDMSGEDVVLLEKGKTTKATKNAKPLTLAQAFTDIAESMEIVKKQADPPKREKMHESGEPKKYTVPGRSKLQEEIAAREAAGQV